MGHTTVDGRGRLLTFAPGIDHPADVDGGPGGEIAASAEKLSYRTALLGIDIHYSDPDGQRADSQGRHGN